MIRTKRFRIEHNGAVSGVGFRPTLAGRGISDYGLHTCPRNVEGGVDVIVKGEEDDIRRFYRDIKNFKLKPVGVEDYLTGELCGYEGEIDFNLCTTGLTVEQMSKFVDSALELTDITHGLKGVTHHGFKKMDENFTELTKVTHHGFKKMDENFTKLTKNFSELTKAILDQNGKK